MLLPNFHPPISPRVLFACILLWILSACGLIQKNFSFQPTGLIHKTYLESSFTNEETVESSDQFLLTRTDNFLDIPNAPFLLLLPPDPRPEIPSGQFLEPSGPSQSLKPIKSGKSITAPKPKGLPSFTIGDDLDRATLIRAVENQIHLLSYHLPDEKLILGNRKVSYSLLKETLVSFLTLLRQNLTQKKFYQLVVDDFEFISAGTARNRQMLFTGYYTPVIEASRTRVLGYEFPIYEKPENLSRTRYIYRQRFKGESYSQLYFIEGPNYTRQDIDGHHLLDHRNLEIAWLKDDMDRYFLHIQGSGLLKFPDGTFQGVQYTGSNGYGYQSVGKKLLKEGVIPVSQGSMQGIKKHFRENPDDIPKYVYQNKRYIFFKRSDGTPRGANGGPVVEGRSIAVDPSYYPYGALGLASAKKPVLNNDHEITGWEKFSRFVVAQDTGADIKGPSHVDLYFGKGEHAGAAAGRFMQKGRLFFLLKK